MHGYVFHHVHIKNRIVMFNVRISMNVIQNQMIMKPLEFLALLAIIVIGLVLFIDWLKHR